MNDIKFETANINRGVQPWDIVKNQILVKLTLLKKEIDEEGKTKLKVTKSDFFKMSGKEFRNYLEIDRRAKVNLTVQVVNKKPEQFQLDGIYILANGKRAWLYTEDDREET